jgi:hypothetical protein
VVVDGRKQLLGGRQPGTSRNARTCCGCVCCSSFVARVGNGGVKVAGAMERADVVVAAEMRFWRCGRRGQRSGVATAEREGERRAVADRPGSDSSADGASTHKTPNRYWLDCTGQDMQRRLP